MAISEIHIRHMRHRLKELDDELERMFDLAPDYQESVRAERDELRRLLNTD